MCVGDTPKTPTTPWGGVQKNEWLYTNKQFLFFFSPNKKGNQHSFCIRNKENTVNLRFVL